MTVMETTQLSTLMREGSRTEHEHAENSSFMDALTSGRVNEAGYAHYLAMFRPIYAALEDVAESLADDPIASAVIDQGLNRLDAIDTDLKYWQQFGEVDITSPAVDEYVTSVRNCSQWGGLFVAHHYTRYLGDLSGGQAIGRILQRTFDLENNQGIEFYRFEAIPKPKPYKDGYRDRLDGLPLNESEKQRIVDEVRSVFLLNSAIFAELAQHLPKYERFA